jgi:hypothetical protein
LAAVLVQLSSAEDARAAIRQAQSLETPWTIAVAKAGLFSGIGVGIDDARMTALWDGLRQVGLPE